MESNPFFHDLVIDGWGAFWWVLVFRTERDLERRNVEVCIFGFGLMLIGPIVVSPRILILYSLKSAVVVTSWTPTSASSSVVITSSASIVSVVTVSTTVSITASVSPVAVPRWSVLDFGLDAGHLDPVNGLLQAIILVLFANKSNVSETSGSVAASLSWKEDVTDLAKFFEDLFDFVLSDVIR